MDIDWYCKWILKLKQNVYENFDKTVKLQEFNYQNGIHDSIFEFVNVLHIIFESHCE